MSLSFRAHPCVALEPAIDARSSIPREPGQVVAHGVERVLIRDDAHRVDDVLLGELHLVGNLEQVTDSVHVAVAQRSFVCCVFPRDRWPFAKDDAGKREICSEHAVPRRQRFER